MNKLYVLLSFILILIGQGCQTPAELAQKKLSRAKTKMAKLITENPTLLSSTDTVMVKYDTISIERKTVQYDTIYIKGGISIDTIVRFTPYDSIVVLEDDKSKVVLVDMGGGQVRGTVTYKDRFITEIDTFYHSDTVFVNTVEKTTTNNINTTQSFWWNLWFQVKGWIWWILIIIAILVILRTIFKFLG